MSLLNIQGFDRSLYSCVSSPDTMCTDLSMEVNYIPTPQRTENMKEFHGAHYGSDLEVDDIIMLTSHSPDLIQHCPMWM